MPESVNGHGRPAATAAPGVVLGVAGTRRDWLTRLSRWSMSASARVEFLRCLTPTEAGAVLGAGRRVALVLIDAASADRDLIALARTHGTSSVLVRDPAHAADWVDLGCATQIDDDVTGDDLIELLNRLGGPPSATSDHVERSVDLTGAPAPAPLVAVLGTGGSGCTTIAMLIAHGLGSDGRRRGRSETTVALVDGTSSAALALYHDLGEAVPGVPELLELHRGDLADPSDVHDLAATVEGRRYALVLGAPRRPAPGLAGEATADAAVAGLRRTFATVVVDAGTVGLALSGPDRSIGLAGAAIRAADVIVAVGRPGLHGTHALARLLVEIGDQRPTAPVLVVCNATRRGAIDRRTFRSALPRRDTAEGPPLAVIDIARMRGLEEIHRSVADLPERTATALARRVASALHRSAPQVVA